MQKKWRELWCSARYLSLYGRINTVTYVRLTQGLSWARSESSLYNQVQVCYTKGAGRRASKAYDYYQHSSMHSYNVSLVDNSARMPQGNGSIIGSGVPSVIGRYGPHSEMTTPLLENQTLFTRWYELYRSNSITYIFLAGICPPAMSMRVVSLLQYLILHQVLTILFILRMFLQDHWEIRVITAPAHSPINYPLLSYRRLSLTLCSLTTLTRLDMNMILLVSSTGVLLEILNAALLAGKRLPGKL